MIYDNDIIYKEAYLKSLKEEQCVGAMGTETYTDADANVPGIPDRWCAFNNKKRKVKLFDSEKKRKEFLESNDEWEGIEVD